jgi:hypothetical protein
MLLLSKLLLLDPPGLAADLMHCADASIPRPMKYPPIRSLSEANLLSAFTASGRIKQPATTNTVRIMHSHVRCAFSSLVVFTIPVAVTTH